MKRYEIWALAFIPAYGDTEYVMFNDFNSHDEAAAWVEDNSWTDLDFRIIER